MYEIVRGGQTVACLFKTQRQAKQAVAQLRAAGFADVRVSERSGKTADEHVDPTVGYTARDFTSVLIGAGFAGEDAQRLTRGIEAGRILITVPSSTRAAEAAAVFAGQPVPPQALAPADAIEETQTAPVGAHSDVEPQRVVALRAERLAVEKERVQGEARIHREVVSEDRTITVPVEREELVVERDGAEPVRIRIPENENPAGR